MSYPNTFAAQTGPLALSTLDANFNWAIDIQSQAVTAAAGGTADALTATYTPAVTSLINGLILYVRASAANATTTPQFSPNGLTARTIVKAAGALAPGEIYGAGHWLQLQYDSTLVAWVLANPFELFVSSSGNVGIGTSSPAYKLDVTGQGRATTGFAVSTDGSTFTPSGLNAIPNYGVGYITSTSQTALSGFGGIPFYTNSTERMRIDSSGNLLVGGASIPGSGNVRSSIGAGLYCFTAYQSGTTAFTAFQVVNGNGEIGSITTSATTTSYNTSSDYRLKEEIAPMTGALAKVAALKPCTYKWKVDGSEGQGFIAHELDEVVSGCVTGEKDAVDANGNPKYQGIDTSFLVATLTAAIQEQQALITSLTARIAALEAR